MIRSLSTLDCVLEKEANDSYPAVVPYFGVKDKTDVCLRQNQLENNQFSSAVTNKTNAEDRITALGMMLNCIRFFFERWYLTLARAW